MLGYQAHQTTNKEPVLQDRGLEVLGELRFLEYEPYEGGSW